MQASCHRCKLELPDVDWLCVSCWLETEELKKNQSQTQPHERKKVVVEK